MNGRITVIQDIERPAPVQLFTPRNSHGYTESIIMADLPDAMSLQYTDEEAGFAKNELTIYNTTDGNKEREPETTQDVPLWGVTSSVQARKLGMYKYAVSKNRPIVAKFSCDFEYLLCNKGDRIRYAGDIALTGISQGRIAGLVRNTVGQIIAVTTDEALPMEAGKSYGMRIRGQDGSIVLHQLVTEVGEFNEAVFAASVGEGEVAEGDLFSFGLLDNDSKEFIITEISCGENLSADITCTEYAPEIFAVDDPAFTLPDYDPKITNVPAVMDGGNITLSNWQTWFTYHDQFDLPSKPTGDGSSNGWHRLATATSMWAASKTARTLSDGEWSEPYPLTGGLRGKILTRVAYTIDASPDSMVVPCDTKGNVLSDITLKFTLRLYQGSHEVADVQWKAGVDGKTVELEGNELEVPTSILRQDVTEIPVYAMQGTGQCTTKAITVTKLYGSPTTKIHKLLVEPAKIKDKGRAIPFPSITKRVVDSNGERDTIYGQVTVEFDGNGEEEAVGWRSADDTFEADTIYGIKYEPIMLAMDKDSVLAAEKDVAAVIYRRTK